MLHHHFGASHAHAHAASGVSRTIVGVRAAVHAVECATAWLPLYVRKVVRARLHIREGFDLSRL